jgi:hypothetical protein
VDMRGEDTSSKQLRDDLMTMLIAGHETTAGMYVWCVLRFVFCVVFCVFCVLCVVFCVLCFVCCVLYVMCGIFVCCMSYVVTPSPICHMLYNPSTTYHPYIYIIYNI